jgi:hypothetical protein
MPRSPGQEIYHSESETMESDGTPAAGDAVARTADGQVTTADGTDNPLVIGVAADVVEDHDAGAFISVHTAGTIVTNATGGVTDGTELGASATEGALTGGSGAGVAFSDAGGAYRGQACPDGYAAVRFGGVV